MLTYLITGFIVLFILEILVQGKSMMFVKNNVIESILAILVWPLMLLMILTGQHKR